MLKTIRIEKVTLTGEKDNYGNPKSIVKVFGDDGFYVSSSAKIASLTPNTEIELEVTQMQSKTGSTYYKLTMPKKDVVANTVLSGTRSGGVKNDAIITRQVAYKGVIELLAHGIVSYSENDLKKLVDLHENAINGVTSQDDIKKDEISQIMEDTTDYSEEDIPL